MKTIILTALVALLCAGAPIKEGYEVGDTAVDFKLKNVDVLVGMDVVLKGDKDLELLILSQNGYGKRSDLKSYKVQRRGGSGIKTMKVTPKTGKLIGAKVVSMANIEDDLILTSSKGTIIRIPFKSVPKLGRVTQGVRVMKPQAGDSVAAFTVL